MFCFILVLTILISILIFSLYFKHKNIETLINYNIDIDTTPISIISESEKYKQKYAKSIPFISFNKNKDSSYITDTFTYVNEYNHKAQSILDDEKVFLLLKKRDSYSYETLDQMIRNNKIVGYPSEIHKKIFEFICKANEVDISTIKMINTSNINDVDVLLFFDSFNNTFNITFNVDFITYDSYNIHLLKFYIPYCKIKNINLIVFPGYINKFPVKTCITFDMILIGTKYIPRIGVENIAESNYMTIYFDFFPEALNVLQKRNQIILNNGDQQILEQFENDNENNIPITPKHAINGYLMANKFYYDKTHIDGIPLISNMKIILENQWNDTENGTYITSENPMIFIKTNIKKPNTSIDDSIDDSRYECIDNPNIKIESICPTTWDRRCDKNEECPFYQANKKYPNYFGGCESGFCQMPLGIKRKGYRKYDPASKPLCHNGTCDINNPDYAFELDQFQRRDLK